MLLNELFGMKKPKKEIAHKSLDKGVLDDWIGFVKNYIRHRPPESGVSLPEYVHNILKQDVARFHRLSKEDQQKAVHLVSAAVK